MPLAQPPRERVFRFARASKNARAGMVELVLLAGLLGAGEAWSQPPAAGSAISNTAGGAATLATGDVQNAGSNTVVTVVQALTALGLTADSTRTARPGDVVTFRHRLTNLGNAPMTVRLGVANRPGDGFDFAAFTLVQDRDRDGIAGPGDLPVAIGGAISLAAGDSADLLVGAQVPPGAPAPSGAALALDADELPGIAGGTLLAHAGHVDSVRTVSIGPPPSIAFYDAGDFARTTRRARLGAPMWVQALAPQCDHDPAVPDTVTVRVSGRLSGDVDDFVAVETGPSTGVFRITPGIRTAIVARTGLTGDGVVSQRRGERITATLFGCGATETTADVWVDPAGITFGASGDAAIEGVRVRLVDVTGQGNGGRPGDAADVRDVDGVTPAPAELVSDGLGRFEFPWVPASTYRFEVTPPADWRFPSHVPFGALPASHVLDPAGSYGGPFAVDTDGQPVAIDLPLDDARPIVLFAEKAAGRSEAEPGDLVDWVVGIANRSDSTATALEVRDALPPGFAYVRGSARLGTAATADPAGDGAHLHFALGDLAGRATATLAYRTRVTPGAARGEAVNRATGSAGGAVSNEAVARITVRGSAFADEGLVSGSVFLDRDGDGLPGPGEPGLAGVRIVVDDGTWAITDERGRYSFAGLTPRTHALKVDGTTLPDAARLVAHDVRDGRRAGLRFVDLTRGELQRADFPCSGDTVRFAEPRERPIAGGPSEVTRLAARGADALTPRLPAADPRALPAARVLTGEAGRGTGVAAASAASGGPAFLGTRAAALPAETLEQILPTLDADPGFIGLADLDTVAGTQVTVRVKGAPGSALALRVNGKLVPLARVGRRAVAASLGIEAWEYVGIALTPGLNVLEVAPPQAVGRIAVRLVAPGPLARVQLAMPRSLPADGHARARIALSLVDQAGVPVGSRTLVTLESTLGRLLVDDLDPVTPGVQVAVEGGRASFALVAPEQPGIARVGATAGELHAHGDVAFTPEQRPLLAVGVLEGIVGWNGFARRGASATSTATGFEAPIEQFANARGDGRAMAAAHGALYARGRVRGDLSLTLGWDSDRPEDQRALRDLTPDRGYPVVGDASVRGYDAQSTGQLYARLDRPGASLLYGDFVTSGIGTDPSGTRSLASYSRSLTGAATRWESGPVAVDAFSSRDRSRRQVDELRGRGISGPYTVAHFPFVENSERVEIVVRDRNQPSLVLSTRLQQRFTDYESEPLTGRILFRAPVPSVDADLNPVFVRVTTELDGGGTPFWVEGANVRGRVGSSLQLAGTYVDDHDPTGARGLRGGSFRAQLAPGTAVTGEWAMTQQARARAGQASRIELTHSAPGFEARAYGVATGDRFDNPGAGFGAGRTEAGGRLSARLAERTRAGLEALYSADAAGRDRRVGVLAELERMLQPAWQGAFGVRVASSRTAGSVEPTSAALRARLAWQPSDRPEWSAYGELEQDMVEASRRLAAVGGEYRLPRRGRLYARHELVSSLSGAWALANGEQQLATVFGVDADVRRDARLFSEYRAGGGIAGRDAQAAVGLRNGWTLDDGLRLSAAFERVHPLGEHGPATGPSTALTGSVDFTGETGWKGSGRMEIRDGRDQLQFLQSLAAAVALDSAWTGLVRHLLTVNDAHGGSTRGDAQERLQLAAAWRPGGVWDALMRWEFHYDRGTAAVPSDAAALAPVDPRARRVANVLAGNVTGRIARRDAVALGWAGKLVREESPGGGVLAGGGQWFRVRATRDLTRDWDVGWQTSVLTGRRFTQHQWGLGAEVGRRLPGDAWLSLGYNRFGYADDELTGEEWTRDGGYLRIRVKFDERLLQRGAEAAR